MVCDELDDCVGEYDECGECNGPGPDEYYDCDGNFIGVNLQIVHNSASPTVDVYIDGSLAIEGFEYRTATPLITLESSFTVGIAPVGDEVIAEFAYDLEQGGSYVVMATGLLGDEITPFDLVATSTTFEVSSDDLVGLEVYHGSTDAPSVDVWANDVPLLTDLSYGEFSGYVEVPATEYTLGIAPAGGEYITAYTAALTGLGGSSAVVFASGFLSGEDPEFGLYAALTDGTVLSLPALEQDCAGVWGGDAEYDCAGECNGDAYENECGCVDGSTGLDQDYCYGCSDPYASNFDPNVTIDDGSCSFDGLEPEITDIIDVPNDQGRNVYISFNASYFDTDSLLSRNVEVYGIERLDVDLDSTWVGVMSSPAYGSDNYTYQVSTVIDSNATSDGMTAFRVVASLEEGIWASEPFWGYSVDNIIPTTPDSLMAFWGIDDEFTINWNEVSDEDFHHYNVYEKLDVNSDYTLLVTDLTTPSFTNFEANTSTYYVITSVDINGNESEFSNEIYSGDYLDVVDSLIPLEFALKNIYPNPFNPVTNITYNVSEIGKVSIAIFDINGKLIEQLIDQNQVPGEYSIVWNAGNNPSGLYFVKMIANRYHKTKKIMVIK